MLRKKSPRTASLRVSGSATRRRTARLHLEWLEPRQLLSASTGTFTTDHIIVPHAGATGSGYTPAQIRTAYGFNSLALFGSTPADGRGQTIAIIDAYNDPNITANLATFDSTFGIAAPPSFKVVNQTGGTSLPGTDPQQGWEGEEALDVEWAHAIAPGANIILVEANSASDANLFAAVNYARNLAGVSVISMSWGSDDNASYASYDQNLANTYLVTPSGHTGITFVASSGDDGVPNFPATSPNVLGVGGTDLHLTSGGQITSETAWTPQTSGGQVWSGGGGVSQEFPGRKVPDVAYNAGVGMAVYDTFGPDTGWESFEGTSAGAPQWSALIAIADEGRALAGLGALNGASQTLAALYAAPTSDFHDITTGSTQFQSAGVGYDLATGLGSPVANMLIPYLAAYGGSGGTTGGGSGGTTGGGSSGGSGGGTTVTAPAVPSNFTGTATSTTQISLSWSAVSGAIGYKVYELESGKQTLLATVTSGTTYLVSGLTAKTSYSFQVSAYNSAGTGTTGWLAVATPAATVTVTAPKNVQATATSSTAVQVSWSAVTGAAGYYVYEWTGSQWVISTSAAAGTTSATIGNQTPGATEYFYVAAFNATSTASSGWVSVNMPAAPSVAIAAPTNVVATATSATTGTISWNASAGATGYALYYWNGVSAALVGTVGAGTTSVSIQGVAAGTTSYFYVLAYNNTTSAASGWVAMTTPATSAVKAADLLYAQAASQSQSRAWWWD